MDIIKITITAVICAVAVILVKEYKPEFTSAAEIAGIAAVSLMIIDKLKDVFSETESLFNSAGVLDDGYLRLLIKVLGIAVITQIGSDICTDNGSTALASNVELAGKIIILAMCFSLLKALVSLSSGLLG